MLAGFADVHLQGSVTKGLRRQGMNVVTAQERGQDRDADELLLETATAEGRVMLTNDQDFLGLHSIWQSAGRTHAGIIYWHHAKYSPGEAISRVILYVAQMSSVKATNSLKYL